MPLLLFFFNRLIFVLLMDRTETKCTNPFFSADFRWICRNNAGIGHMFRVSRHCDALWRHEPSLLTAVVRYVQSLSVLRQSSLLKVIFVFTIFILRLGELTAVEVKKNIRAVFLELIVFSLTIGFFFGRYFASKTGRFHLTLVKKLKIAKNQ